MENRKEVGAASSSSSFTMDLFGPKHSSPPSSSVGIFGSVFGPSSTGLGKDTSQSKYAAGSSRKKDSASHHHGTAKHGATEYKTQRSKSKSGSKYENEAMEQPCYLSSSIYYGGQEVYPPNTTQSTDSHNTFTNDGGVGQDSNGNKSNDASRGNWWQGSLYY